MRLEIVLAGERAHTARPWMGRNAIHRLGAVLRILEEYQPRMPVIDDCVVTLSMTLVTPLRPLFFSSNKKTSPSADQPIDGMVPRNPPILACGSGEKDRTWPLANQRNQLDPQVDRRSGSREPTRDF